MVSFTVAFTWVPTHVSGKLVTRSVGDFHLIAYPLGTVPFEFLVPGHPECLSGVCDGRISCSAGMGWLDGRNDCARGGHCVAGWGVDLRMRYNCGGGACHGVVAEELLS